MKKSVIYPDLEGKVVVVTGGGSGIGEAIVRRFAQQGSKVGFIDIAEGPSKSLAAELTAAGHAVHFEQCDLRDIAALKAAFANIRAKFGLIGALVNNAAHDERHATLDVTPEYYDDRMNVNLRHQFFAAQAVIPDMQKLGGGSIINFGSTSWMVGMGGLAVYTAAKSAILGLTRSLARDFGPDNIRVNTIAPGWIMTERQKTLWWTPEADKALMEKQCIKRHLLPDDMARMALFFISEESGSCTNQQYIADGGWV